MSRDIAIFHIIIEITNADRGFVSNELLMKKYGKCEKTISSALTNLKKIGLITITIVNGKNFITCNLICFGFNSPKLCFVIYCRNGRKQLYSQES